MKKKNWLAKRREDLGLYQADLAASLEDYGIKVSRASISNWESGKFNPPLDNPDFRRALANILKMTIPEMLSLAGYEISAEYDQDSLRAADIVNQLPQESKTLALGLLEQMLNQAQHH